LMTDLESDFNGQEMITKPANLKRALNSMNPFEVLTVKKS